MNNTEIESTTIASLPRWDLNDLYSGFESAEFAHDLRSAEFAASKLKDHYEGKVGTLSSVALAKLIEEFELIHESIIKLNSYAYLQYCTRTNDHGAAQFYQNTTEQTNNISSQLLFIMLEINQIDEKKFDNMIADSTLAKYKAWLQDIRVFRPHQLSSNLEILFNDKKVSGENAWIRLFDETVSSLKFSIEDKNYSSSEVLNLLSDPSQEKRRQGAKSIANVFKENIGIFSLIINTLAKDKEIEDRWRNFSCPISSRNLSNQVEDYVVDSLVSAVKEKYPSLSHRYYKIKAKWMGSDKLDYWDRNAPLPEDDNRLISWDEATDIVLSAYQGFSPQLADIGKRFFDNAWIDAATYSGKVSGAFAHPTSIGVHPYLLLNYQGRSRDVMTLAHELGHGVHQVLAQPQGQLLSDTPLTLAETASVFGEQLVFRAMLEAETNQVNRRVMLANKVEDMLNTVVRQVAFCEFERQFHQERRTGELTAKRIGEIWLANQEESLGPAVKLDENYQYFWAYIPHFIHSPFYVYAYAFGDCLVNALYAVYQEGEIGFKAKYIEMLSAGGTLRHKDLLAPFGLDAGQPDFWSRGLNIMAQFIDQLESEL